MQKVYSVSQVNAYIRGLFDDDILLARVQLKGELSNVKYHHSGHIYFTVKDSQAAIAGVMFASDAVSLDFRLEEGQSVVVTGRIGVYERDGRYQIYAKSISREGQGLLYEKYEKLRQELADMGMFDEMYKQPIPKFIRTLGVVTAPTGAAVRDIINVSLRRNPYLQIILYPAKVQGEGAAESIVAGIEALQQKNVDVIIVGRGGGSIEDLWAFNEEIVARAIFDCMVPVISGTGHETDTTIADWVADLRAPTPSAAAELAVYDHEAFMDSLKGYQDKLNSVMSNRLSRNRERLNALSAGFMRFSPEGSLKEKKARLHNYRQEFIRRMDRILQDNRTEEVRIEDSLTGLMQEKLRTAKEKTAIYAERLNGLSPLNTLSRGYTFTERDGGKPLRDVNEVKPGDEIMIYVQNGKVFADVTKTEERKRTDY
ncbi:Exodeoxyribonuclease VII large subunit [Lachnospiraceae bacterium]|nr:Exodeoxyribonuclease VII large subunit [Lachnospiraceae bacterium]